MAKKRKFKKGDIVRIRQWDDMEKEFGLNFWGSIRCAYSFSTPMKAFCGKKAVIEGTYGSCGVHLKFSDGTITGLFSFSTDMIEHDNFRNDKIIIYRKDEKTVVAKNLATKKEATAVCSKDDEFDFYDGSMIAFGRLLEDAVIVEHAEKMNARLKVGDTVEITTTGALYTTYPDWVFENVKDRHDIVSYAFREYPNSDDSRFKVIAVAPHGKEPDKTLYYIKAQSSGRCFLIGERGIKKA